MPSGPVYCVESKRAHLQTQSDEHSDVSAATLQKKNCGNNVILKTSD